MASGIYKIGRSTLEDIANAIRDKLGTTAAIKVSNFASEIGRIMGEKKMITTEADFDSNEYYGMEVAKVAETYLYARQISGCPWNYNAVSIFDNYTQTAHDTEEANFENAEAEDTDDDDESDYDASILDPDYQAYFNGYDPCGTLATDSNPVYRLYGYATKPYLKYQNKYIAPIIDCSSFVSLVLRGIDYGSSPWGVKAYPGDDGFTWTPSTDLPAMVANSGYAWAQKQLDYQPEGLYSDLGISGYSSVRLAAELGEFYYKCGDIIYDRPINSLAQRKANVPTESEIWPLLKPGDLVFFTGRKEVDADYDDYETESETKDDGTVHYYTLSIHNRFRCISHVAIVGTDHTTILEVTNGQFSLPNGVYKRKLWSTNKKINGLTLVIRPDYRPRTAAISTKIGDNQCVYPWYYSQKSAYESDGGSTLTTSGENTITITGTTTSAATLGVKGSQTEEETAMWLSAGTYTLSMGTTPNWTSGQLNLQVRHSDNSEFATAIRAYSGHDAKFTLDSAESVLVRLYIADGLTFGTTGTVIKPSLIRTA